MSKLSKIGLKLSSGFWKTKRRVGLMCVFCNQEENEPATFTQADGCREIEHTDKPVPEPDLGFLDALSEISRRNVEDFERECHRLSMI
jgi:hypothetical protein